MAWRGIVWAVGSAAWLMGSMGAKADPARDAVMEGAARCEGIPDNRVWLDCFYGSAQPMRAQLGLAPALDSQTRLVPGPGASYGGASSGGASSSGAPTVRRAPAKKSEGFFSSILGNTTPLASNMPMTAYGFGGDGRFTVTMSDSHVWQQAESDIRRAKWKKAAASYKVTINNGISTDLYDMRVEGVIYKVTRVK